MGRMEYGVGWERDVAWWKDERLVGGKNNRIAILTVLLYVENALLSAVRLLEKVMVVMMMMMMMRMMMMMMMMMIMKMMKMIIMRMMKMMIRMMKMMMVKKQ